ncbi:MAG TPA: fibronectin type III domain-containing protein [Thermoanaerobaculia bacterium]|nr:fibronectin type III domain-containing protein [Thermoanaerobaculia bacterium]
MDWSRTFSRTLLPALLAAVAAAPAGATTYVMVPDEALVDQAPVAAVVRVAAVDPEASRRGGPVETEYRLEIEEVLKGQVAGGTVLLRVPGGLRPDGLGLRLYGAPELRAGERALVFLEPNGRGAFRPVQLFLGVFHQVEAGGLRLAVRDLSGTTEVRIQGDRLEPVEKSRGEVPRDFDAFKRWVAARAQGRRPAADYRVTKGLTGKNGLGSSFEPYTVFRDRTDNHPLRWFVFDNGGRVDWNASTQGEPGVPGGGFTELRASLQVWTDEPETPVVYRYAGTTAETGGLSEPDGLNTVLFNDPDDLVPEFNCTGRSGVLAIGGPWYERSTLPFQGRTFHRIAEADIVVNSGLACFFDTSNNARKAAEELFSHELGHTLGLGHSCGDTNSPPCQAGTLPDEALMRAFIHDDGRGARINEDDRAGLRFLYRPGAAPGAPARPTRLTARGISTTEIELTWNDNASDETEYRVEVKTLHGTFEDVGAVSTNTTSAVVEGLEPATAYVFRIRANGPGGFSAYSNEATAATLAPIGGPCVPDARTLCLVDGRFSVQASWRTPDASGTGWVAPTPTDTSGNLWFFSADNWEVLAKVIDACAVNDHFWVLAGSATSVEHDLQVIDTRTGQVRVYPNAGGSRPRAVTDDRAFDCE